MEKRQKFIESIPGVALGTGVLLLIPLVAMQFTNEVNWGPLDFVIAAALLFGAGTSYVTLIRHAGNLVYKVACAAAIGTTLLMVWANLAVGLIGSGPHAGNLMYIGVVAVVIGGTFLSRFKAAGMERVMFAAAISLVVIAAVALFAGMQNYQSSSVLEILGVNGFFATLYVITGMLFRFVAQEQMAQHTGE